MMKALRNRGLLYIDTFIPYNIASIGAHLFNLINLSREEEEHPRDAILYVQGKPFNCRLHIMFVAPPGYMKSTVIEHFLRDRQALLYGSCIDTQVEGFMTEAGFVGTLREGPDGLTIKKPGVALRHQNSIIGMEEFAILATIMESGTYGGTLVDQLLTALDSGNIGKSLAPGSLKYKTNATVWTGTQVQRFELASGLPRRFIFMVWFPTKSDQENLRNKWFDGFNLKWEPRIVNRIASCVNATAMKLDRLSVGSVTYEPEVKEYILSTGAPHYEFQLFIRLLIGDMIMNDEFNKNIRLNLKSGRKELIERELKWRDIVRYDAQMAQVKAVLRGFDGRMIRDELLKELNLLGVDRLEGIKTIDQMIKFKILMRDKREVYIPIDKGWFKK